MTQGVKREKWKNYYRLTYRTGFYSLDQLIQLYQDYELHGEDWAKTPQYGIFFSRSIGFATSNK